ncbi:O-fucosyltransferase family protein [Zea mays]|uniref:O-fucosyltransferase family protein n=1 Tax=Zea mays TaxID=4577 RepID=A0A1D6LQH6_MAIZE|nr:O-fucosyltransferase family protein [Zea mays]
MGLKATGARSNTMKLDNNVDMNSVDTAGVEDLMDTIEEVKPYWTKPSPKNQPSNGFVTFSLTMGPEYHISRITDVVVVARYLGATFVLPDIRGNELGNKRGLELKHEYSEVARKMLDRLQELSKKSDWKDDIMPAENKGEFLKSSNADLARALDLEICSQSDMFIPAVAGLFYGYVTGKRIASGRT